MTEKTMQLTDSSDESAQAGNSSTTSCHLDGIDVRVEKDADGNITAEPAGATDINEVADAARDIVSRPDSEQDVRVCRGKVRVEATPLYTDELTEIKKLGLSLSYITFEGEAVFVHEQFGDDGYCFSFGSDGSSQA